MKKHYSAQETAVGIVTHELASLAMTSYAMLTKGTSEIVQNQ